MATTHRGHRGGRATSRSTIERTGALRLMLNNTSTPVPGSRILGLGHYQPSNVVTNDDLVARGVDTDDAWIRSRVGVAERRFADPDETVVDMAEAAASKALAAGGVE